VFHDSIESFLDYEKRALRNYVPGFVCFSEVGHVISRVANITNRDATLLRYTCLGKGDARTSPPGSSRATSFLCHAIVAVIVVVGAWYCS